MYIDVRKYLGRQYDMAHPCMALVADVLHEEFHVQGIPSISVGSNPRKRAEIAHSVLSQYCTEITRSLTREGDVILVNVNGWPVHVGVMISSRDVLHYPDEGMGVVVESLDSIWLKNRVAGYYRIRDEHFARTNHK